MRTEGAPNSSANPEIDEIGPVGAALTPFPPDGPSIDDELRDWKQKRKKHFAIPWRQFSIIAGLSFGIASFALPDSVNDGFTWLLYALAAASFYAGLRKRKQI